MASLLKRWIFKSIGMGAVAVALLSLSACGMFSSGESGRNKTANWTAAQLYAEARVKLSEGNYTSAAKTFEDIQIRYPFGLYAQQALMEMAYAHWKNNDLDQARAAADRFIKTYPNHPNIDYAYYLKGLISFNDDLGLFSKISRQDLTERDPKSLQESFDAFKELTVRYPDSRYTEDAILRMRYLVNAMAMHDIHVADYYLRRGAYLAAANRAQNVVRNYPESSATKYALHIMLASYDSLGMNELRDDARRVLDLNYPNSDPNEYRSLKGQKPWWQIW